MTQSANVQKTDAMPDLKTMANAIRALAMDAVEKANSGHPGMPMGMADVATILFTKFINFDPKNPEWPDRDRFILSAGHGSMLLYALNYLLGYDKMTIMLADPPEKLDDFEELLRPYGIVEVQRSGRVALPKLARQVPTLHAVTG